ncbi:MAG: hypothetical protein M1840_000136 [Geoglossum simile]|nr:MAG: hypothetical protein M1840_000136 [Geoglossum simile]
MRNPPIRRDYELGDFGLLWISPTPATIPSTKSHRPASIPLRTLVQASHREDGTSSSLLDSERDQHGGSPNSPRSSVGSDFSLCSSTGDIAEQLADNSRRLRSRERLDEEDLGRSARRVRYQHRDSSELKPAHHGLNKEDITIPSPRPKQPSRADRALVYIMSGGRGGGQMQGLTGKALLYFTSIFVSLGVFLFGYDQGVMSGIITGPYFKDYFNQPTRAQLGTMVAILEVGAFASSLIVGRVGDILGRRKTIFYGSIIFVTGGFLQTIAGSMAMMILGRIIAGVGVGTLSTIVPVYQSEISPPHNRGKLACIEFTGNIIGYATSVWVDYFCSFIESDYSWRLPLFMQCVMGALLALGSLVICESPRWLLDNDQNEEGIVVIANLYGGGDIHNHKAREEYREIRMDVLLQRQEGERSYSDMFKRYRKRVFIAMSAQAFAQLNGINVISYYAPLVFEQAGWVGRDAILMTGINGITYVLSTIPPWYLVDRWGRRPILLSGAIVMMLALSLISYFIYIDVHYTPTMVVVFVMIYNAFFGYSWGPIPWLYPPEILPLSIRAKGASLSTASNWAFNWLVGEVTPVLQEAIKWRLYLVHAFFCAASFVVVYFTYPETRGVRLEDMDAIFGDASTALPTPATGAERTSLVGGRALSPVPSLDVRRGVQGRHVAGFPGLDIDPPFVSVENGKPQLNKKSSSEGASGWITRMIKRGKGGGKGNGNGSEGGGDYQRLDQAEDREE